MIIKALFQLQHFPCYYVCGFKNKEVRGTYVMVPALDFYCYDATYFFWYLLYHEDGGSNLDLIDAFLFE